MKRILNLLFILLPGIFVMSCDKVENPDDDKKNQDSDITAVLGVAVNGLDGVLELPENQSKDYDIMVTADPGPADALNVSLKVDEALVAKYNAANGTSYQMLPSDAYELPAASLLLMRYNKTSALGTIRFKGAGCQADQVYVLPVVVDKVQGTAAYEAPEDKALYVLFKMLPPELEGTGTQDRPYDVDGVETFNKIGNMLKENETVYLKLTADIDFAGAAWTPIDATGKKIFLDGDGHKVSNVKAETALFYVLDGTVQNLTVEGADISTGAKSAGLLADVTSANSLIRNVKVVSSKIVNTGYTGGLVGQLVDSSVEEVEVQCEVTGSQRVGGLVGHSIRSAITRCVATGNVKSDIYYVGGLVGMLYGSTLTECSASGNVESVSGNYSRAGGLVGEMIANSSLEKCHATGKVSGAGYFAGGLIGVIDALDDEDMLVEATISKCYATGNVLLQKGSKWAGAGALVGRMQRGKINITDCYATGAVKADRWSSGFVGDVNNGNLTITNGYSSSDLSNLGPDAAGNYTHGIVVGYVREPAKVTIACKGFVAWNVSDRAFCYPADAMSDAGNYYGKQETISAQATALGWNAEVWDLSGDEPKLK